MLAHRPKFLLPILLALLACVAAAYWRWRSREPVMEGKVDMKQAQAMAAQLAALQEQETKIARTVWRLEILAEEQGKVFEELWDGLNSVTNKLELAASVPVQRVFPPAFAKPTQLAHSILEFRSTGAGQPWTTEDWRRIIEARQAEGWELAQAELRHNRFEVDESERPKRSEIRLTAHLFNASRNERAAIDGDLLVEWDNESLPGHSVVKSVDASRLALKTRAGDPAFQLLLDETIKPVEGSHFIDPLIVRDLDGDGVQEIILPSRNLLFRRGAEGAYRQEALCRHAPGLIFTGIFADFDGDGAADFLCATFTGLLLFKGTAKGTFDEPGLPVWTANPKLKYAQVLTCGDIDGDGDLDVWLGQYKVPYERGQMPAPYFDANDGHPSYMLLNDGHGQFKDATGESGLARKRLRRCYSASLADLNGDGSQDLLVVSDFAGADLYLNDGRGHFKEATREWIPEPHAFGMAHALADFDGDARLDLLMIGMNSPTASRLEHLGLKRPGFKHYDAMRAKMIYGNRLFLRRADGPGFGAAGLNASIANAGWAWGCGVFDFDNDGFNDVYIANGHVSRKSVHDHEPEFWLHDIYVGNSRDSVVNYAYLGGKFAATQEKGHSYGGYEKNRLFLNQKGAAFTEIGFLMGVGLELDSRNVVAADLDGDGRPDLLVTTMEMWPAERQTLKAYRNTLAGAGNWIGFQLADAPGGASPIGAQVTIRSQGRAQVRMITTGDSYRSQSPETVHFGIGTAAVVDSAEIHWPNGKTLSLPSPAINRYHKVKIP